MSAEYQFLGTAQPKSLYATEYPEMGSVRNMSRVVDKKLFGARVAARRIELGLSQDDLAKAAGMRQQGIGAIESGVVERPRKLKEIATTLKIDEDWLLYGGQRAMKQRPLIDSFDPDNDDRTSTGVDRLDIAPGITADGQSTVIVPRGGVVEIEIEPGLGGGGFATETYVRTPDGNHFPADAVRGIWQLPDHVFTQMRSRSQNVRCFPVQGDSMLDTLDEGDFVFVDVAHRVPSPPGIYALDDGFGGVIVKRLEVVDEEDGEAIVRVLSDNARYAERRERADSLRIVGRYIAMFTMRNRR